MGKLSIRLKTLDELKLYLTKSLVSGKGWLLGTFGLPKLERWMVRKRTPKKFNLEERSFDPFKLLI